MQAALHLAPHVKMMHVMECVVMDVGVGNSCVVIVAFMSAATITTPVADKTSYK